MKFRTLALAAMIATAATGLAFAQSSPSPANQSGPGVSPTTPSPTDPAAGESSVKGIPSRPVNSKMNSGTTGSGASLKSAPSTANSMKDSREKTVSPASPNEGLKSQK